MNIFDAPLNAIEDRAIKGLEDLKGKTIIDIGFIQEFPPSIESNLTIDYKDGDTIKRIVLRYRGDESLSIMATIWVAWQGVKGKANPEDPLKNKIKEICENGKHSKTLMPPFEFNKLCIEHDSQQKHYKFMNGSEEIFILTETEIELIEPTAIAIICSLYGWALH